MVPGEVLPGEDEPVRLWRCPACGYEKNAAWMVYALACWCQQPPVRMLEIEVVNAVVEVVEVQCDPVGRTGSLTGSKP